MPGRCYRILVILLLFLSGCSFLGQQNTPGNESDTPESIPPTITPTVLKKTPTIKHTETPKPTSLKPTNIPLPTNTTRPLLPSPSPFPDPWYILQTGTPLATYNTPHEAAGCSWLGVGGQIFGADNVPELGVSILVGGTLDDAKVGSLGTTGMETNIGEGGYEVTLADHPMGSNGTLWIQVVNSIGEPQSRKIYFNTYNDCERNFILINFNRYTSQENQEAGWHAYLPVLMNRSSIQGTPVP